MYGAGAAATVVGTTVRVCVGTGAVVSAVVMTGGGGAGGRLEVVDKDEGVDDAVAGLSSLMEPFIMVILGTLIGGIVIAMYLPIFKMGSVV